MLYFSIIKYVLFGEIFLGNAYMDLLIFISSLQVAHYSLTCCKQFLVKCFTGFLNIRRVALLNERPLYVGLVLSLCSWSRVFQMLRL